MSLKKCSVKVCKNVSWSYSPKAASKSCGKMRLTREEVRPVEDNISQQEVVRMREGPIVIFALSTRLGPLPVDSPIVIELVQCILGCVSHDEIIVHTAPSVV